MMLVLLFFVVCAGIGAGLVAEGLTGSDRVGSGVWILSTMLGFIALFTFGA